MIYFFADTKFSNMSKSYFYCCCLTLLVHVKFTWYNLRVSVMDNFSLFVTRIEIYVVVQKMDELADKGGT